MEFKDVVYARKSIRKFKPDPVSKEALEAVLTVAGRAASGMNIQPWEFFVIAGPALESIKRQHIDNLQKGVAPAPEAAYSVWPGDSVYRRRQVELGKELFRLMNIQRDDMTQRIDWAQRGFRFFDAPAAIILTHDRILDDPGPLLDMGAVMQMICLAAVEHGMGTCIEGQGVQYPDVLRQFAGIPESKKIVTAIAIGYPDPDFPANRLESTREPVDALTTWIGFD